MTSSFAVAIKTSPASPDAWVTALHAVSHAYLKELLLQTDVVRTIMTSILSKLPQSCSDVLAASLLTHSSSASATTTTNETPVVAEIHRIQTRWPYTCEGVLADLNALEGHVVEMREDLAGHRRAARRLFEAHCPRGTVWEDGEAQDRADALAGFQAQCLERDRVVGDQDGLCEGGEGWVVLEEHERALGERVMAFAALSNYGIVDAVHGCLRRMVRCEVVKNWRHQVRGLMDAVEKMKS